VDVLAANADPLTTWPDDAARLTAGRSSGRLTLLLLRLALDLASTLAGFGGWVLVECPVAPVCHACTARPAPTPHPRKADKTARFLDLETEREGSPTSVPLARVAWVAAEVAPGLPEHRRRSHRPSKGRPWPPGTEIPDDPHVRQRPGHLHGSGPVMFQRICAPP
jgi:hypothetical protein